MRDMVQAIKGCQSRAFASHFGGRNELTASRAWASNRRTGPRAGSRPRRCRRKTPPSQAAGIHLQFSQWPSSPKGSCMATAERARKTARRSVADTDWNATSSICDNFAHLLRHPVRHDRSGVGQLAHLLRRQAGQNGLKPFQHFLRPEPSHCPNNFAGAAVWGRELPARCMAKLNR